MQLKHHQTIHSCLLCFFVFCVFLYLRASGKTHACVAMVEHFGTQKNFSHLSNINIL